MTEDSKAKPEDVGDDSVSFAQVSNLEFAAGWPSGHEAWQDDTTPARDPISALEDVLRPALQMNPCVLGFSGGRDSSALLAVAVRLARREGLAEPIPLTNRYPTLPETDENEWQELVIRHLGIREWLRRDIGGELDLLSESARRSLLSYGAQWPATLHNRAPTISAAAGGCYIDGEGGDAMFGEFRVTPFTQLVRGKRSLNMDAIRKSMLALSPAPARRRVLSRQLPAHYFRPWLKPEASETFLRAVVDDEARRPLSYAAALKRSASRRGVVIAFANLDTMGRSLGVAYIHPFLDQRFISALSKTTGALGHTSRTAAMTALFGDCLPASLLARLTKPHFNGAYVHDATREFLATWDGSGLDENLIDVDGLRQMWSGPVVHGGSFQLIQAAWLAQAR